jgi:D-lactate dehydrogenase
MKLAFFDAKPHDIEWFDRMNEKYGFEIKYFESKLNNDTALLAKGSDAIVAFVNDSLDAKTLECLYSQGIRLAALRSAGYNNVDFKAAYEKVHIVRVPEYSPHAVAEHAAALMLAINRKIHKAYIRVRESNFSITGLMGFDLYGKTVGVIGTGRIGRVFADICKGFGMRVLAYDLYPAEGAGVEYVPLKKLYAESDVISLHCPLTEKTRHMICRDAIETMKKGALIINTSRGGLIDTEALVEGLKARHLGGAGLDVYEEESEYFFEDLSNEIIQDDLLARLISFPNVLVTSHQGFFTREAMRNIAEVTLHNIQEFRNGDYMENEICYNCQRKETPECGHKNGKNCF